MPPYQFKPACLLLLCLLINACQTVSQAPIHATIHAPTQEPAPAGSQGAEIQIEAVHRAPLPSVSTTANQESKAATESLHSLWDRIRAGLVFQDFYEYPAVAEQLQNYRGNQRFFDLLASRAEPFLYGIVEEIEKRNLPMELALLPAVESTYNPRASSSENAVGLWQIMSNTGSSLGLQQDWWYDGRRDPLPATIAALDYLQALYQQFDSDWMLALAAYNTGPANVQRALRRADSDEREFWSLPLALETQVHIPRLLALSRIIEDPAAFGVELEPIPNAQALSKVEIGRQIDLARVAELLEIEDEELRALNPGYLQWATHPETPQHIAVPAGQVQQLRDSLASLDTSEFVSWEHYTIRPGDTLSTIARRLNTTVDVLQVVNQLQGSQIIAGRSLLIPRGSGANDYTNLTAPALESSQRQPVPEVYTVRSGDNLWLIARRFDLRSREIAAWNNLSMDALLHPGQTLDLGFARQEALALGQANRSGHTTDYIVVRGDSPARIAEMFDIDLGEFLNWNNLDTGSIIYPGQVMQLSPTEQRLN
ncbi:MAG: LysM peptidoglycan-binding domain-containing protein [Gammaproteobacteria bacterium]